MTEHEGPEPGATASQANAPPLADGGLVTRVIRETPDVILMLQRSGDGLLRCQTAISSFPTAPSLGKMQGLTIDQILPSDALQRFGRRYDEATRRHGPVRYEERIPLDDAEVILDAAITPIFDRDGACSHVFWSARNVTDQWATREALRRTEERLQELAAEHGEALERQEGARSAEQADLDERARVLEAQQAEIEAARRQLDEGQATVDEQTRLLEQREEALEERLLALEAERQAVAAQEGSWDEERRAFEEDRARTEEDRATLEAERAALEAERTELDSARAEVDGARSELERDLASLGAERNRLEEGSAELERERAALGDRVAALEEERRTLEERGGALEEERRELEERVRTLEEERRELEDERASAGGDHDLVFREAAIGIAWSDRRGTLLEVNRALAGMVGQAPEDLVGSLLHDLVHAEEQPALERLLDEVGTGSASRTETRFAHASGETSHVEIAVTPVGVEDGDDRLLWQVVDLTERRGLQERLAHQALHDSLTGLPNRMLFLDRLSRSLTRLDRNPSIVAVMVLDLDGFSDVNEREGHEVGDRVLASVAGRLRDAIRTSDTVARLESDEFGILCEDLSADEDADTLADRIRAAVEGALVVDGVKIHVRMSMGVALSTDTAERPEALLRDASLAMREAKDAGRSRTEIFDQTRRDETALRMKTETDLERAIEHGEFRVFYQPQIDLGTGTIVGVEVLVRWQQPDRGLVTPAEFIPLAEETGLIVPLGTWILEQACQQSKRWEGVAGYPLLTWVNMSPRQLAQPDLPEIVSKVIADTGAEASTLCMEVTEGVLLEETGRALTALRAIKEIGLQIGIDDFGKGFSSLSYLKRLPVDVLKLDRSFVQGLGQSREDGAIAAAVVNLARAMDLTSIAEGVETPQQLAYLRELGCDLAQGYLFASPQPAEVIEQLLAQDLRW